MLSDFGGEKASADIKWNALDEVDSRRRIGMLDLEGVNDLPRADLLVVERIVNFEDALLPQRVFRNPEYKKNFLNEALGAGVKLSLGVISVLFTDIVGSTEFYESNGDARAFQQVQGHFVRVFEGVQKHGGSVVKTIGDSVLAVFSNSTSALEAALYIQEMFSGISRDSTIRLRISLHAGPALAANLDTGIDYFGRTINFAAKLQANADAGEIAILEVVLAQNPTAPDKHDHRMTTIHIKGRPQQDKVCTLIVPMASSIGKRSA